MDHQHIWFPTDDFDIWNINYEDVTRHVPRPPGPSNLTQHARPNSAGQPPSGARSYPNSYPLPLEEVAAFARASSVPSRFPIISQQFRESALPAYDTYWQPSDVALQRGPPQIQGLSSSTASALSRVSTPTILSRAIMNNSPLPTDTLVVGEPAMPVGTAEMPGSQGGPIKLHYPHHSTEHQGTSRQAVDLPSALHAVDEGFVRMSFPLQTADHLRKRECLRSVLLSPWKLSNQFEPDASLLLQFMRHDATEGRWYCSFWRDGKTCECSCKKKDHAKGHIRSHLDLLPYVCSENCPTSSSGCGRRYPAIEPLQKHRKGKATCEGCGMSILPANLKRHMGACMGRAPGDEHQSNLFI